MSRTETYDVIIVGAGSIGTPMAFYMAKAGLSVLVIDQYMSTGQGSNKHAIGGIRATHSDPSKIHLCATSLERLSHWQEEYGDDIEWLQGGYSYVAYEPDIEKTLKDLIALQRSLGLDISWHSPEEIQALVPHISMEGLLGGTYSPGDGFASPLKVSFAYHKHAEALGARFLFNEVVECIETNGQKVTGVRTNLGAYRAGIVVNAAGSWAATLSETVGVEIPVRPDAHEGGITEPITKMLTPMVVDMRARPGSSNFYFYQHPSGKIIFCVTPSPQIWGTQSLDTSEFLPQACRRLVEVMPILKNCRVRRTWRGTYPMTPDGSPILGKVAGLDGYLLAVGMCGQGFMLGPGVGELMTRLVTGETNEKDEQTLHALRLDRDFSFTEKLK